MNAVDKLPLLTNARSYVAHLLNYDVAIETDHAAKAEAFRLLTTEERAQLVAIAARWDKDLLRLNTALRAVEDREEAVKP